MPDVLLCQGTALQLPLKDASVHCVVTSPPYYGLRDYSTGTWDGGNPACTHVQGKARHDATNGRHNSSTFHGSMSTEHGGGSTYFAGVCPRCGATRVDQQLGLEASSEAYIAAMVQVFREVKRVLHPTGTCWINMGDSYNAAGRAGHGTRIGYKQGTNRASATGQDVCRPQSATLGEKQLLGMPWRLAFALQNDGWILRSAITWCKAAPMPESVRDRPTSATEMVFLFAKQPHYFYDNVAVRVSGGTGWHGSSFTSAHDVATKPGLGQQPRAETTGHNLWDYWVLGPEPSSYAHYACMPTALVRRCLLAGAPVRVCAACSAPYRRVVERAFTGAYNLDEGQRQQDRCGGVLTGGTARVTLGRTEHISTRTTGMQPTCSCNAGVGKGVILDPFCGSGTVPLVARELGHHALGLDLSYHYLSTIARERLGFAALHAWTHGQPPQVVVYDDLPLFGG